LRSPRRREQNFFLRSDVSQQALAKFGIGPAIDPFRIPYCALQRIVESCVILGQIAMDFPGHNSLQF
jgi:hypothetical protein